MDRQPRLSAVAVVAVGAVAAEVVAVVPAAAVAVEGAEERQTAAARMREMSQPMEASYLIRHKP